MSQVITATDTLNKLVRLNDFLVCFGHNDKNVLQEIDLTKQQLLDLTLRFINNLEDNFLQKNSYKTKEDFTSSFSLINKSLSIFTSQKLTSDLNSLEIFFHEYEKNSFEILERENMKNLRSAILHFNFERYA